jgi:hypothetical protein
MVDEGLWRPLRAFTLGSDPAVAVHVDKGIDTS